MTKRADIRQDLKKEFSDNGWRVQFRRGGASCWLKGLEFGERNYVSIGANKHRPSWTIAAEGLKRYLQEKGIWSPEQREKNPWNPDALSTRAHMVYDDNGNHIGFEEGPLR